MENENEVNYSSILDDTNQLIQVSELDTFNMLYANHTAKEFSLSKEESLEGQKCYKYMMGLEAQCPFCPLRSMDGKDVEECEIDNGQQVFKVKTRKIQKNGKELFVEYASDITAIKRAQEIFRSQMQTLIRSIPEAQGIFHMNLTKDKWISTNGVSKTVDSFPEFKCVDDLVYSTSSYIPVESQREEYNSTFCRENLLRAYSNGKNEVSLTVQSYFDDGSVRWAKISARLIMNPDTGDLETIIYGMDVDEEMHMKEKVASIELENKILEERTRRDGLTGLYSKDTFEHMVQEYVSSPVMKNCAVLFLDLDHFKDVNDTFGHIKGDQLLVDAAKQIKSIFQNDLVSRFGGDEFCIFMKEVGMDELKEKVERLLVELRRDVEDAQDKAIVHVSASVGVVYAKEKVNDSISLIREADMALYQAKEKGRDTYCIKIIE